jgi:YVTN family beta-propeller protein
MYKRGTAPEHPPARRASKIPLVALAALVSGPTLGSSFPASAAPTPGTAWALGYSEGSPLIPISLDSGQLGPAVQITNGFDDCALAITPDGQAAYVAQNATNTVVAVNLATGANSALITVGEEPTAIAIAPDGRTAYVVTGGPQIGGGSIVPIDTVTNTADAPIYAGLAPTAIAIAPDGLTAYVVDQVSDAVTPINLASRKTESPIYPITSPDDGGSELDGIGISPDGKTAYVVSARWESSTPNEVVPVNLTTGRAGTPIKLGDPEATPLNITIAPNGLFAYVTEIVLRSGPGSAVVPVNLTTGLADAPIYLNGPKGSHVVVEPWAIAVAPDGRTAYVADEGVGWVTPINLMTDTAEAPVRTGYKSEAVAIMPDQAPVAAFSVQLGRAGSPSTFDGSASKSSSSPIATYNWDFGDGTGITTPASEVRHTYVKPGQYVITLTVTDEAGTSTTQIFTGQTMSNNGGPQARAERRVAIEPRLVLVPTTLRLPQ